MTKKEYIEKVKLLNYYTELYDKGNPIISDKEWDTIYFDIVNYEKNTGFISDESPTSTIHYEIKTNLTKIKHSHPMLSLAKTKSIDEIKKWVNNRDTIVMAKMDGLTCSLTYENGNLILAETRGDGKIGEDITHNAKVINSIPNKISYTDKITIDGEIICKYDDFEDFSSEYKNARNFASGSIRLLDSKECSKRKLTFIAWDIIDNTFITFEEKLNWLKQYFIVVPYITNDIFNTQKLKDECTRFNYPIDGLVYRINNNKEWINLGHDEHDYKGSIAFKFSDEEYETTLKNINFTMGKTGALTPVAYFEPVVIDGTTIQNASLHNLSILKEILGIPYKGQKIWVIKANMIIPQISRAEKNSIDKKQILIPKTCPICESETKIDKKYSTEVLICSNPKCKGKLINKIEHFCGKNAFDIENLSTSTIEKLISYGWINSYKDIFTLYKHKKEWLEKEGFGNKSIEKILENIENVKSIDLSNLISAIGIPNIEKKTAKTIANHFKTWSDFRSAINSKYDFTNIDGIGIITSKDILEFDYSEVDSIIDFLHINEVKNSIGKLNGKRFCITGTLSKKRDDIIKLIEENGGEFTGVNKQLDYLICNDSNSTSSKIKKAKELGIKIISEKEFMSFL